MLIEAGGAGREEPSDRGTWSWSAASPLVSGERAARRDGGHLKMTHSSHVSGQLGGLLFLGFDAGPRYDYCPKFKMKILDNQN